MLNLMIEENLNMPNEVKPQLLDEDALKAIKAFVNSIKGDLQIAIGNKSDKIEIVDLTPLDEE